MQLDKRKIDLAIISDVHLGTFGTQPKLLLRYLKSIDPHTLIINGDLIDCWAFSKRYWPKSHMQVLLYLLEMARDGVRIYYLTGNHDEMMRKFVGFRMGGVEILNQLVIDCNGKKAWVFHGDAFDASMQGSKRMAKFGGWCYDGVVRINRLVNAGLKFGSLKPVHFSKWLKDATKKMVNKVSSLEQSVARAALQKGYDFVICGHVHRPEITNICIEEGEIMYLNSGDWIENLTALEWDQGKWSLFRYQEDPNLKVLPEEMTEDLLPQVSSNQTLFQQMTTELGISKTTKTKKEKPKPELV